MKLISDISFIWNTFGSYKKSAVILLFIILCSAVVETLSIGMILPLLDIVIGSDISSSQNKYFSRFLNLFPEKHQLLLVCGITLFLIFAKSLFHLLSNYYSTRFITNLRKYWSGGMMKNYLYSKFSSLNRQRQGVLLNNMINEPSFASKALRDLIDFAANIILSFSIIILLSVVNWRITAIVLSISVIIMLMIWKVTQRYSLAVGKKKIELNQQIGGIAAESISGIRQIKTFSMEKLIIREFFKRLDILFNLIVRFNLMSSLPKAFTEMIVMVAVIGIIIFYRYAINVPVASIIPLLGFFLVASQRLFGKLSTLLSERMSILSYIPSLKLVSTTVNENSVLEKINDGERFGTIRNGIRFDGVRFFYGNRKPLFDGLNIEIKKGCITAIVGPSGSGKSTICDLLIRFYKPISGRILIDDKDLKEYNIQSWRNCIGYVSQEAFLFNLSVRENILIGKPEAGNDEILFAAKQADADGFIDTLPQKYDTIIGDSGLVLSGGQRQRIAIARALIRNPELLILDEATSSLDSESEQSIFESLKKLRGTKTILIITHRVSSLAFADQIYVLDNGVIVESGRYDELNRKRGLFWRLEQISKRELVESFEMSQT